MKILRFILALAVCIVIHTGLNTAEAQSPAPAIQAEIVADNLDHPWALAFLPDDEGYLITERGGRLWHISADAVQRRAITGLPDDLAPGGQGGLLDIVPGPDFRKTSFVYFSYSAGDTGGRRNTQVARAVLDLEQQQLRDLETIFTARPKVDGGRHFGSRLLFGPKGHLFITLGERGRKNQAQNPRNHLGALVRLNPDGSVPADNPFVDDPGRRDGIYSYGHRNIQGIARQPGTDRIWLHEHGPRGGDEVNIVQKGANYGWPKVTHGIDYDGSIISKKTSMPGMVASVIHWTPSIAPSGLAFYDGVRFPQWQGDAFAGALAERHLRYMGVEDAAITDQYELLGDMGARIRDVRSGPDGYLYVLTDARNGKLIRITPRNASE
jgi:glucose/arabinose dehydrogenase